MSEESLWDDVCHQCLSQALILLDHEAVPTAATVETVSRLIGIAVSIDRLNLDWSAQSRYDAAAWSDRHGPLK